MKKDALKDEEIDVNDIILEKLMIIYSIALEKVKIKIRTLCMDSWVNI